MRPPCSPQKSCLNLHGHLHVNLNLIRVNKSQNNYANVCASIYDHVFQSFGLKGFN